MFTFGRRKKQQQVTEALVRAYRDMCNEEGLPMPPGMEEQLDALANRGYPKDLLGRAQTDRCALSTAHEMPNLWSGS
jgi:hypothetical protein